jgi:hypothetical protein
MAKRPVYIPTSNGPSMVEVLQVDFTWHPGMSKTQKQRSIRSLHEAANKRGVNKILEISSKSEEELGVRLSAFNLRIKRQDGSRPSVESLFQGSKVFSEGGPFTDMYLMDSRDAKKDERLKLCGKLVAFRYDSRDWPLFPRTAFYDWLYISALQQNSNLSMQLMEYDGFTDIEFNPEKSLNCQAASAALYKSLVNRRLIEAALSSPEEFIRVHAELKINSEHTQDRLF